MGAVPVETQSGLAALREAARGCRHSVGMARHQRFGGDCDPAGIGGRAERVLFLGRRVWLIVACVLVIAATLLVAATAAGAGSVRGETPSLRATAGWLVRTLPAGGQNLSITVADLNGDGNDDLVVPPYVMSGGGRSTAVAVLLGDGEGGFSGPTDVATVDTPFSVAVGDFSGDGRADLAVASGSSFSFGTPGDGNLAVNLGNGDGTFAAPVLYDNGGSFWPAVVASDLNGDSRLDLAVASVGMRSIPPRDQEAVTVLFGTGTGVGGNGLFSPALAFAAGPSPVSVAVADFNADGKPDLAVADAGDPEPGNVAILLGNGAGTFAAATLFAQGSYPQQVAVGDFNGDGRPDVAAANGSAGVAILLGNGDGTFAGPSGFPAGGSAASVAVADFDRDGKQDLAVALGAGGVSILPGNGEGTFADPTGVATGHYSRSLAVGDFNRDTRPDLAVANDDGTVSLLLNTPAPTAVTVHAFTAKRLNSAVLLRWRTGSETDVLGFDLYRVRGGARTRLNGTRIAATRTPSGRSYTWRDRRPGRSPHYLLEVIRRDGSRSTYPSDTSEWEK